MVERRGAPRTTDPAAGLRREVAAFFDPQSWRSPLPDFEHSGYALVERIREWRPRFAVDVGCGDNPFKGKIPNLLGMDLVNPGLPTGPGLAFFPWSPTHVDAIGSTAGLRRDGPIRYDAYRNDRGEHEPRLVWTYRPVTAPHDPAATR